MSHDETLQYIRKDCLHRFGYSLGQILGMARGWSLFCTRLSLPSPEGRSKARGARWVNHMLRTIAFKKERRPRNYVLPKKKKAENLHAPRQVGPRGRMYEARITLTLGNIGRGKEGLFVTRK